jgi:hypothetical protein
MSSPPNVSRQEAHVIDHQQLAGSASKGRRRSLRRSARLLAGVSLAATLAGSGAAAAAASPAVAASTPAAVSSRLVAVSAEARLPFGASVVGAVAGTSVEAGAVALKLPDQSAVQQFIDNVSNPRAADYHHYLSRGQFSTVFGPSKATISAVQGQLEANGLKVTGISSNGILVSFSGSASRIEAAFHTGLDRVRLADGSFGQVTTSTVALPASIASQVQAVVGLDQLVHETSPAMRPTVHSKVLPGPAQPHTASPGPVACTAALQDAANYGGTTDQQVGYAYGADPLYGANDIGAGQTVDIYELEPFDLSDVNQFDACYFPNGRPGTVSVTPVDGGPGTGPGSGEAALDVQDVAAIAPGADIHVFSGPNMDTNIGPIDTWNAIAVADDASQISTSWGVCETALQEGAPGVQQVENEIFEQTAAQGQTVFSAAGDDGSDDCAAHDNAPVATDLSLDDPASQPYVVSVGGTTFLNTDEPPDETVWNNGTDGGAGGGGISESWEMPAWQAEDTVVPQTGADEACSNDPSGTADNYHLAGIPTQLPAGTLCRETPDVSALADPQTGITIVYGGGWTVIGGTSSSTPLWAAMLAEMNASSFCSAASIGFASPLLYQVAGSSAANYAEAFNDITVGNNDNLGVGGAVDYAAGPGYDMASGLGTPRLTDANGAPGLAQQLCADASAAAGKSGAAPIVSNLSPSTGPIAGGGSLTITGTNFGATAGAVYFGNSRAHIPTVGDWSNTSITLTIPDYTTRIAPPGTPPGSAGRALVTVVTAAPAPESSAPNVKSIFEYTADASGTPVVDYVSQAYGPTAGTNEVEIVGSDFIGATAVHFGTAAATIDGTPTANEMEVTVPASNGTCAVAATQGICAVAVTVTVGSTTSSGPTILPAYQGPLVYGPNGAFAPPAGCDCEVYQQPEEYDYSGVPTIASVSPSYMSENGGSTAVITGTNFNLLTFNWANIGPAGQNFSSDFSIEGITSTTLTIGVPGAEPSTEPEPIALSLQFADQVSSVSQITYAGTPTLTSISADAGSVAGPNSLTITGTGLSDVDQVLFVAQPPFPGIYSTSSTFTAQSDTSLTVAVPQFFAVPTDVLVCSVTGCDPPDPAVDTYVFAYPGQPVVTSSSPSSGPAHGGTLVTIQGSLDAEVLSVHFGSTAAVIESAAEGTASAPITVLAPAGTAGAKVDVTITTVGGTLVGQPTSAVTSAATFTYQLSSPANPIAVTAVPTPGGAAVTWKAPTDDGGATVGSYLITANPVSGLPQGTTPVTETVPATLTKAVFSLLAHGVWSFTVQAVNSLGAGLPGISANLTTGALPAQGYWLAAANGSVFASGHALPYVGTSVSGSNKITGAASTPDGGGYWLVSASGQVFPRGDAPTIGGLAAGVASDIVSITATDDGLGYWLLGANGQVYPFGDAAYHGDLLHLPGGQQVHVTNIVGMEAAPNGTGYILIGSDGGVFALGAVHFYGSLPGLGVKVNDIRGILAAPAGTGYVLVGADGGAFVFGHGAPFKGSLPGRGITVSDIVGLSLTPDGQGYWMAGANGATYAFGDAAVFGSPAGIASELPVAAIAGT